MPFAVALLQGLASLPECPLLEESVIKDLEKSLRKADWREDLIASLRLKIKEMDLSAVTKDIGGDFHGSKLHIACLGREFTVSPDGEIEGEGYLTPWMKILLLHYITTHGRPISPADGWHTAN